MGGLTSSLGFGGGDGTGKSGVNYVASGANILNPTTVAQANTAYDQTQQALSQQNNFLSALQAQNGIGNQSAVYNQLGNIAAGKGPNPAQAMLAQATGANVAQQAALMAGQRGAGANAGLIAREAAMQGSNAQQQAIGQGATMQANQALNALNMQGGLATQQVGQQANATGAYTNAALNQQQNLLNSINAQNNANVGMQSNMNNANAGIANTVAQGQQGLVSGIMGGIGGALGLAHGGKVPNYADGGEITPVIPTISTEAPTDPNAPRSKVGQFHASRDAGNTPAFGDFTPQTPGAKSLQTGGSQMGAGIGGALKSLLSKKPGGEQSTAMAGGPMDAGSMPAAAMVANKGGKVPAMVSPGEVYLPPEKAKEVVTKGKNPISTGERIPGKAKVKGDNLKNDTVSKTLEAGGIVIPRSVMESDDAANKAAQFVAAHLAKNGRMPRKS